MPFEDDVRLSHTTYSTMYSLCIEYIPNVFNTLIIVERIVVGHYNGNGAASEHSAGNNTIRNTKVVENVVDVPQPSPHPSISHLIVAEIVTL